MFYNGKLSKDATTVIGYWADLSRTIEEKHTHARYRGVSKDELLTLMQYIAGDAFLGKIKVVGAKKVNDVSELAKATGMSELELKQLYFVKLMQSSPEIKAPSPFLFKTAEEIDAEGSKLFGTAWGGNNKASVGKLNIDELEKDEKLNAFFTKLKVSAWTKPFAVDRREEAFCTKPFVWEEMPVQNVGEHLVDLILTGYAWGVCNITTDESAFTLRKYFVLSWRAIRDSGGDLAGYLSQCDCFRRNNLTFDENFSLSFDVARAYAEKIGGETKKILVDYFLAPSMRMGLTRNELEYPFMLKFFELVWYGDFIKRDTVGRLVLDENDPYKFDAYCVGVEEDGKLVYRKGQLNEMLHNFIPNIPGLFDTQTYRSTLLGFADGDKERTRAYTTLLNYVALKKYFKDITDVKICDSCVLPWLNSDMYFLFSDTEEHKHRYYVKDEEMRTAMLERIKEAGASETCNEVILVSEAMPVSDLTSGEFISYEDFKLNARRFHAFLYTFNMQSSTLEEPGLQVAEAWKLLDRLFESAPGGVKTKLMPLSELFNGEGLYQSSYRYSYNICPFIWIRNPYNWSSNLYLKSTYDCERDLGVLLYSIYDGDMKMFIPILFKDGLVKYLHWKDLGEYIPYLVEEEDDDDRKNIIERAMLQYKLVSNMSLDAVEMLTGLATLDPSAVDMEV